MTELEWVIGDDTGVSSKAIWAVMMGAVDASARWHNYAPPADPSDFGRCYRLLALFPAWRTMLGRVATRFPLWGPMVAAWEEMERLYRRDLDSGQSVELYDLMKRLEAEGRRAAGWKETSPGCWTIPVPSAATNAV